jgi:hypothetical protein
MQMEVDPQIQWFSSRKKPRPQNLSSLRGLVLPSVANFPKQAVYIILCWLFVEVRHALGVTIGSSVPGNPACVCGAHSLTRLSPAT